MDLTKTRSLLSTDATDAPADERAVEFPLVASALEGRTRLYCAGLMPESIRLKDGASELARHAVACLTTEHTLGRYRTSYPFVATYEVWFWLSAVVARPLPLTETAAASAKKLRKLRIAAEVERERGEHEHADELEREAAHLEGQRGRRGNRPDTRRAVGGLGAFLLALRDHRFSWDNLTDLIYSAARGSDWFPYAPVKDDDLRRYPPGGWSEHQLGGRGRLRDALETAVSREKKARRRR